MDWKVAPTYQNWNVIEVNEKEHKAFVQTTCDRCGGSGMYIIPPFFSGTCFQCNGMGKLNKWVKAYTPSEYDRYVKNQEKARERKKEKEEKRIEELKNNSEANKAKLIEKFGFDVNDPAIYVVTGNTFEIKDILKERGAHYNCCFNWYFNTEVEVPEGHELVKIPFDKVYDWNPITKSIDIKDDAKEIVTELKAEREPKSNSEYVGEIKERLRDLEVTLKSARPITGPYGTSILFTFDYNENQLVWFTSSPPELDKAIVGHTYLLTGTVKAHDEYNGVKQTKINRCILKEI